MTAKSPGDACAPVIAARNGWATAPSFRCSRSAKPRAAASSRSAFQASSSESSAASLPSMTGAVAGHKLGRLWVEYERTFIQIKRRIFASVPVLFSHAT